jgi:hypothetical protein
MQDRPTAGELLEVVARFLEGEIVPTTTGSRRFQALVAANVMRIVTREIQLEETHMRDEVSALAALLDRPHPSTDTIEDLRRSAQSLNQELCERIRAGELDSESARTRTVEALRRIVQNKLVIANPRYL